MIPNRNKTHLPLSRYVYIGSHDCGTQSNSGFAFNEGWAEFWAGECADDKLGEFLALFAFIQRIFAYLVASYAKKGISCLNTIVLHLKL